MVSRLRNVYGNIGQLVSAKAKEYGGATSCWHEQSGYRHYTSGNWASRTHHALVETYTVDPLKQLAQRDRKGIPGKIVNAANNLSSPPHSRGDPVSNHVKRIQCLCLDE
jgi:hypothetical protein